MVSSVELISVGNLPQSSSELSYTDAQIQRAVCHAFAALAGIAAATLVAVSYFGIFQITVLTSLPLTIPLIAIAGSLLYYAARIPDTQSRRICASLSDMRTEMAHSHFEEMVQKYGLDALQQTFSVADLKKKFESEVQDPKTTFWSVAKRYDLPALLDHGIIDQSHFDLLQDLKKRAAVHEDVYVIRNQKRVLTLFANKPLAFKAIIALDAEYKSKIAPGSLPNQPPIHLSATDVDVPPPSQRPYVDAKVKRAVFFVFAALAGLAAVGMAAVAHFAVFNISIGFAIFPLVTAIAFLYFASKVIDYQDPGEQKKLRAEFANSHFESLYHEHGLNHLLQVFDIDELKQKFNDEALDPKTTFWNVLREYDIQELCRTGIISPQHYALLVNLRRACVPFIGLRVHPGVERWERTLWRPSTTSHHVLTSFSNEPEVFRMIEALDSAYKSSLA